MNIIFELTYGVYILEKTILHSFTPILKKYRKYFS